MSQSRFHLRYPASSDTSAARSSVGGTRDHSCVTSTSDHACITSRGNRADDEREHH